MTSPKQILALIGSYRKGGVADQAADAVLAGARAAGAEVRKVYLIDRHIEFCTNCRNCTQQAGPGIDACPLQDEMAPLLQEIQQHDAFVIASPMNFFTVTAVTKRFIERLICMASWPWGTLAPKLPPQPHRRRAVLIVSMAAPSLAIPPFSHIGRILKLTAKMLGAPKPRMLWIGLAAKHRRTELSERTQRKAHRLGRSLAA